MEIKRRINQMQFGTTWDTQTLATITLTDAEIEQIYRERKLYYIMQDVRDQMPQCADDSLIRKIAEKFERAINKNATYSDGYWMTMQEVIEEV